MFATFLLILIFCLFPATWGGMYTETIHKPYSQPWYDTNMEAIWKREKRDGVGRPRVTVQHVCSSTRAKGKCIWRKTSSGTAAQQRAQRPSSTCGKWAPASVFPRENTLLCPPPLSPIRTETFTCGCSQRNRLTSSMFLPQISASF